MFDKTTEISDKYTKRREFVFLLLAGLFVGTLAMLNILGITRLIDLSFTLFGTKIPFRVFVGILPYPITFLCTDFISELYGKKRASNVVWIGFILNLWVIFILWVGGMHEYSIALFFEPDQRFLRYIIFLGFYVKM